MCGFQTDGGRWHRYHIEKLLILMQYEKQLLKFEVSGLTK